MRVELSGPISLLAALEVAAASTPGISLEGGPQFQESARLGLDLKQVADLIGIAKDFADLVALCWGGVQVLRSLRTTRQPAEAASSPERLEITTPSRRAAV